MNKQALEILFATQFLTRIPLPFLNKIPTDCVKDILPRIHLWFPLVGGFIGLCTATICFLLSQFFPLPIAILLALGFEIMLTGAFHEDAFADFCDGFGGGLTPEKVHEIMKDSRIGTYGVAGLIFALSTRYAATIFIPPEHLFTALLFSESISRIMPLVVMKLVPPVDFNVKISKDINAEIDTKEILLSALYSLPFWVFGAFVLGFKIIIIGALAALFLVWFVRILNRKLGGRNGDCLGFATYVAKLLCLLMFVS